jgi:hypothetical protein
MHVPIMHIIQQFHSLIIRRNVSLPASIHFETCFVLQCLLFKHYSALFVNLSLLPFRAVCNWNYYRHLNAVNGDKQSHKKKHLKEE